MKKKVVFFLVLLTSMSIWIVSCTKQSADKLKASNNNSCDTTSVKYSADITPILQQNCYTCHGNGNSGGSGGIVLEGYSNLSTFANNGYLVGDVTHASGFVAMPYQEAMLPACEVNKIVAWVNQGTLNN